VIDTPGGDTPDEAAAPIPAPLKPRRRWIAAVLSSVIPGLGHLVAGRRRLAALFGLPVVALVVGVAVAVVALGPVRFAASFVEPQVLWALLGVQAALIAWRLAAMASSVLDPRLPHPRRRDLLPIGLLVAFIVAPQGWALAVTNAVRETTDAVFVGDGVPSGAWVPPSPSPSPGGTAAPNLTPPAGASPSPSPGPQRITVLVIGVDAGVGRRTFLTDTMVVASLDPVAGTVSLVSVPRDTVDVPLPGGGTFPEKINSLVSYARHNPTQFPGSSGEGQDVLMAALGELLGVKIDYYAQVSLGGFVYVIDKLGGIDVNVARGFCDASYHEYGYAHGFSITKGPHHLDGSGALAYARVRHPTGESDFTRAARQQEVLSGVREAVVKGRFLDDPIGLLQALSRAVQTDIPRSMVPDLVVWVSRVGREQTYRAVIDHPLVGSGFDGRGSIQIPDLEAIRALAARLFTEPGTLPPDDLKAPAPLPGKATTGGVGGCRPNPTPQPTPKPSATPGPTDASGPTPPPAPTPTPTAVASEPAATPTPAPTP
jgi:LCP family protein required for cell wall assembly